MPLGLGAPGPMGGMNPQNLEAMAAAGDPRAIQMLQQMRQQALQGGGGAPGGMPPGGGGMPPMQGAQPMGGAPSMSQAEFSGYGQGGPGNPDLMALRQKQLEMLLRAQQGR